MRWAAKRFCQPFRFRRSQRDFGALNRNPGTVVRFFRCVEPGKWAFCNLLPRQNKFLPWWAALGRGRAETVTGQSVRSLLNKLWSSARPMPVSFLLPHSTGFFPAGSGSPSNLLQYLFSTVWSEAWRMFIFLTVLMMIHDGTIRLKSGGNRRILDSRWQAEEGEETPPQ